MTCARRARIMVPAGRPRRPRPHPRTDLNRAGEIEDAIERADREAFTREPPKTLKGQIGYLIRQFGSAKAVAQEIGVTADSVNRY